MAWALYYPPVLDLRPADFPDRPGETLAAAGPALHRGSRPGRPRRRPGQRRGRPGHRQRSAGVRAPGRAAPRRGTSRRGRSRHRPGAGPRRRRTRRRARAPVHRGRGPERPGASRAPWPSRRPRPIPGRPPPGWRSPTPSRQPSTSTARSRASSRRCSSGRATRWPMRAWPSSGCRSGDLDRARVAAAEGARLDPGGARVQSVLGFAALAQIRRREATEAFERAIAARSGGAPAAARSRA